MPLIKNGQLTDDHWHSLTDVDDLPQGGDFIIPLARLEELSGQFKSHDGKLGLEVPNTIDPFSLTEHLPDISIIVLELPSFTDGRAYSQARVLRNDLGFKGELRIKGDVLPDQAAYLTATGFDSFEIYGTFDEEIWHQAMGAISLSYQYGYHDGRRHRS